MRENETLAEVKVRVQSKLQVSDDEFSKVLILITYSAFDCNAVVADVLLEVDSLMTNLLRSFD